MLVAKSDESPIAGAGIPRANEVKNGRYFDLRLSANLAEQLVATPVRSSVRAGQRTPPRRWPNEPNISILIDTDSSRSILVRLAVSATTDFWPTL